MLIFVSGTKLYQFISLLFSYCLKMVDQGDVPAILQGFVQPRTINQDMLINLIIEQGPKGIAGKLFYEDGINLDETKEIRIEFLNILKINHLWVIPNLVKLKLSNNVIEKIENLDVLVNLTELDLSFNCIKVIENLNNLPKLEILLLFNNEINEIRGLENLHNLTIFSIGNNAVANWEHVMYLRKFRNLCSLNMSGNPCTKQDGYLDYVYAFIPQLIYYEYKMITSEQRKRAIEKHIRTLNTLQEVDKREQEELLARKEYEEKLASLTIAYVEHLDGDYLFYQMFENDKEGRDLSLVTEDTETAYEQYKVNFIAICEEFCEIGIKEHEKRIDEINVFNAAVNEGKIASQDKGRMIVNEVLQKKTDVLASVKQLLKKLVGDVDTATLEDITQKAQQYSEEFNDMITDVWSKLMSIEVDLHEQLEDVNEIFRMNISDMVDSFLTIARGYFSQLRNSEAEYNDAINGAILYYLSGFGDDAKIPAHLRNLCEDKEMLNYNLNNSHDKHLQILDTREDTLLHRIKNWLVEFIEQLIKSEIDRNNQQLLEISHFADSQQQELFQLLQQLNINANDSEAMLALDT